MNLDSIPRTQTYSVQLNVDELEFIRYCLQGLNEFQKFLYQDWKAKYSFYDIDLEELADKIFRQYHDGNGELLKQKCSIYEITE